MQGRFAKFAIIGVFNTLFNLLLFNFFVFTVGLGALAANAVAVVISICISFALNSKFVFTKNNFDDFHATFAKFLAITLISQLVVQQLALLFFLDVFKSPGHIAYSVGQHLPGLHNSSKLFFDANTAKVLSVIITMMVNFISYEKLVFNRWHPPKSA